MGYKSSKYNILLNREKPYLLFNTFRLSLSRIEHDKLNAVQELLNCEKIEKSRTDGLFAKLASGGFIIPAEFDELEYLKLAYFKTKFSEDILELGIFVTKACNFRCSYCFENTDSSEYITSENIKRIVKFAEKKIKKTKTMFVNWFGGEPLLRFDIITTLTEYFMRLCDKYSCKYAAYLTTNGYLLTPDIADKLPQLKIGSIQTTLDGPGNIHNKRRMLKRGGETYNVILDNLTYIVNNDLPVSLHVRCNVDKENLQYLEDWIKTFPADFTAKVHIHFAPVTSSGEDKSPAFRRRNTCIDAKNSSAVIPALMRFASDYGFVLDFDKQRKNVYCNRDKCNQFIIGADLSLIACPVGMDKIGYISEGGEAKFDLIKHIHWLSKDPFSDNECRVCKLLPLCIGGCNLVRVRARKKGCIILKYDIEEWVRLLFKTTVKSV